MELETRGCWIYFLFLSFLKAREYVVALYLVVHDRQKEIKNKKAILDNLQLRGKWSCERSLKN
jgi:hypothetical protein